MRRLLCALLVALLMPQLVCAQSARSYSLPEARLAAQEALTQRAYGLALQLGMGLLQADPNDGQAHFIVSQAQAGLGQLAKARKAARKAFAKARKPRDRFTAAQASAGLALRDGRYGAAQYWLRRALETAPAPAARRQTIADFKRLQALKTVTWDLDLALGPSSNVNAGAETAELSIDGLTPVGVLSADAQALSGSVAKVDLRARYKLHSTSNSLWHWQLRVFQRNVRLSTAAKARAPELHSSDLSFGRYELGLQKLWHTNQRPQQALHAPRRHRLSLTLGETLSAGKKYSSALTVGYLQQQNPAPGASFVWGGQLSQLTYSAPPKHRGTELELRANFTKNLENKSYFQAGLTLRHIETAQINTSQRSVLAHLRYGFGQPVGPAKLDLTLSVQHSHFADYAIGFIRVPGGRTDKSAAATLNLRFESYERAGFVPSLALQYQASRSNISRFTARGATLTLGLSSSF